MTINNPQTLHNLLQGTGYLPPPDLTTSLFLACKMHRPLLLEGEAGIGKTELAKALARAMNIPLIRLQCYEGIDVHQAVYEWDYARQYLEIQLAQSQNKNIVADDLFTDSYLLQRPLLRSLFQPSASVLLIDELDRSDEAFEAFLLEFLAEYQITIPELGTLTAKEKPYVIITSNRTRELSDALKRRCLYQWLEYPDRSRERDILHQKFPQLSQTLSDEITSFVHEIRDMNMIKNPGIAETLDWAQALIALDAMALEPEIIQQSLGVLLKHQEDIQKIQQGDLKKIIQDTRRKASQP